MQTFARWPARRCACAWSTPWETDVADEALVTTPRGAVTKEVAFAKNGHTGRFQVRLELDDGKHTLLANELIRVADFETPRFKVDVERDATGATDAQKLKARIVGRYLFGSPMGGAKVTWVNQEVERAP